MSKIRTSRFFEFNSSTWVLMAIVLVATVSSASAKEHKPRGYDAESHVVAHISFSGRSAVDMAMQRKVNDKYYLYVEHSKDRLVRKSGEKNHESFMRIDRPDMRVVSVGKK
jgi:hypothetical protein